MSSSAAIASRSRCRASASLAAMRTLRRLRDARTASRNVRARLRPASSGAVASRAVSRSSRVETRPDPTAQPPAAWSSDAARRRSGTSEWANHVTSPSAVAKSACHVRRRRARSRSGTATATATITAASNHHNHAVASVLSAVDPAADGDDVSDDVGAAAKPTLVVPRSGNSLVVTAWVGGTGRVNDRVGLAGSAVSAGVSGRAGRPGEGLGWSPSGSVMRLPIATTSPTAGSVMRLPIATTSPTAGSGLPLLRTR